MLLSALLKWKDGMVTCCDQVAVEERFLRPTQAAARNQTSA
jgi:hypothetical protein